MIYLIFLILLIFVTIVSIVLQLKKPHETTNYEKLIKDEFQRSREESANSLRTNREEIAGNFKNFGDSLFKQILGLSEIVDSKLKNIQEDNSKKLEEMRKTVDEKLHETLEKRLSESFKQVSERLELVHKGLGEMQNLALGVGDLKKVLSNVKTRGVLGEIQLENILEQVLTQGQYRKNIVTKAGSNMPVEFAIKIPSKDPAISDIYLPIDSKFPMDRYHALVESYESGDPEKVDIASKELEMAIKKSAKDIFDKYLDPPNTTDFAIMFLPIEGLYAEIARRATLFESLRKEYKVIISGPTTLVATLSSLQMGFRTLAIEKRTGEVWQILGEVKTEFDKFGNVLENAKKKINEAGNEIDTLVGTRTKMIQSKLRKVGELPSAEDSKKLN